MAYRRSITTTAALLRRRFLPSFSHIIYRNNDDDKPHTPCLVPSQPATANWFLGGFYNGTTWLGSSYSRRLGLESPSCRYFSTNAGDGADKIDDFGYGAEVIAENTAGTVASQAPAVSEVATAAADSFLPIAWLQYLIDGIHSISGLNWWASIALTTILIRTATVPVLINQLKATSKLNLLRPRLEELREQMQNMAGDPDAMAKGQEQVKALFKEYGVTPFTPLKGLLIQGPVFISFFLAIRNMAERVPSFKSGGAFWFVDLTTPDSLFILPILTALTFWISVECNMQEGLEGNPVAGTMKKYSRVLAVISVPIMMSFPKAIFCYWLTSNLFSLTYGFAIRQPEVKKLLGLTEIAQPSTAPHTNSTMSSECKRDAAVDPPRSSSNDPTKGSRRKISSSSVLSQRLRSLEKQLKKKSR